MLEKIREILILLAPYLPRIIEWFKSKRRIKPVPGAKVLWSLTVVVMDGSDMNEHAVIPVTEAVEFIEARTRFDFNVTYVVTDVAHGFTAYETDRTRYVMLAAGDIPDNYIQTLPVSTSYLFLYKLGDKEAAQAGSAMAIEYGLNIAGKLRPYATAPTDQWWYVNTPSQGFRSWAAQILTHEIINTIQAKVEAPPYNCGQLTGTPGVACDIHESERLEKLTDKIYEALGANED